MYKWTGQAVFVCSLVRIMSSASGVHEQGGVVSASRRQRRHASQLVARGPGLGNRLQVASHVQPCGVERLAALLLYPLPPLPQCIGKPFRVAVVFVAGAGFVDDLDAPRMTPTL